MKMTVRKDGRFQAVIREDEHGNRLPKPVYFYDRDPKKLELKVRQFRVEQARSRLFSEVREAWEEEHFAKISHNTCVCYAPALKRAAEHFDEMEIKSITPLEIERTVRLMAEQGYSHQSCKVYLSVMRQICDYAVLHSEIDINPCNAIKLPRGLPKTRRVPPADNLIETIIAHVNDDFGLYLYFLLYSGLRRGEALAIRMEDIDFTARVIHVRRSVYFVGDRPHLKVTKTEAGTRDVDLLNRLYDQLLPYQGKRGYLFGGVRLMTLKEFNKAFNSYALNAGLAYTERVTRMRTRRGKAEQYEKTYVRHLVTSHQLRHAYATILFEADVDVKDAQLLLGHSKEEVTRNTYTHIRDQRKRKTAGKINSYLDDERPADQKSDTRLTPEDAGKLLKILENIQIAQRNNQNQ